MAGQDFSIPTSCLVADYIQYRTNKDSSSKKNNLRNEVTDMMRNICEEFERRFEKQLSELSLNSSTVDFDSYTTILASVIEGGCNWGRVVAIVAFAGAISANCLENGGSVENVDLIRDWTVSFLNKYVDKWIKENNGWRGLMEFYNSGLNKQEAKRNGWASKLFAGTVGAIAIGALFASRA